MTLTAASLFVLQSCDKEDVRLDSNELPSAAQTFITTNYPDETVTYCEKDYDDWSYVYDVQLSDGTRIEFDKKGEWQEIENRVEGVKESVVPAPIWAYVTTNYTELFIVDIEKDYRGYDVELNNDLDLDFDPEGNFVRIDN